MTRKPPRSGVAVAAQRRRAGAHKDKRRRRVGDFAAYACRGCDALIMTTAENESWYCSRCLSRGRGD